METIQENPTPISNKKNQKRKYIYAGIIGNIMEWFDYGLYGYFAIAISINFFPTDDKIVSLILSFLVFGLGFLARPLGGFIFGHYADKFGRKNILSITVILMGVSTFIMGILPTYAQIGLTAPIILALVRLLQGISAGGEWGSAVSFLGEYAKPHNRAFIVSFSQVGSAVGLLLGSLTGLLFTNIFTEAALLSYGWRIAFLFGIVIAFFGYFLRKNVEETPVFQEKALSGEIPSSPLKEVFQFHKYRMLTAFLLASGGLVTYWLIFSFMPTYISQFLKLPLNVGFSLTSITLLSYIVALPFAGYLADRFGRRTIMLIGSIGIVVLSYPLFLILSNTQSFFVMILIVMILAMTFALFQGPNTVAMNELFPSKVRVSGFSIPYQLASAVFAGTALSIATWLIDITKNVLAMPIYMIALMCVSLFATIFLYKETKDIPYED